MLGGSFVRDFEGNDPFFAVHRQHMNQMQSMFMDPFQMHNSMLGITDGRDHHREGRRQQQVPRPIPNQIVPFGLFNNDFGFGNMFTNMRRMMDEMHRSFDPASSPESQMYSQSSFMSYSKVGSEAPKVFQASSSTRQGPGGVKETRKTLRDSQTGVEKMAVGRHIQDRGHVIERSRNRRTGDQSENQDFLNMDEEDADTFNRDWQENIRRINRGIEHPRRGDRNRHNPIANGRNGRSLAALPDSRQQHRTNSYRDRE